MTSNISESSSGSSPSQTRTTQEDMLLRGWFVVLLTLIALLGHSMVFLAWYRERVLRTLQNIFIINLSAADFLFSIIVPPIHVVRLFRKREELSEIPCYLTGLASMLLCLASIHTLTFISIERFMATNHLIKHRLFFDGKLVKVALVLIWSWSAVLTSFPLLTTKYVFLPTFFHCSPDWATHLPTTIALAGLGIGLPLIVLIYCNFHIVWALRKSRLANNDCRHRGNAFYQREKTMSVLTVTVVTIFTVSWAPYCAAMLCLAHGKCAFSKNFMHLALILSISNSFCNPLIYGLLNKNFRKAFQRILTCQPTTRAIRRNTRRYNTSSVISNEI